MCCYDDEFSKPVEVYRGRDAAHKFLERILEIKKEIRGKHFCKPLVMSEKDERGFKRATNCHICGKKCRGNNRVRDHCHVTGTVNTED